MLTNRRSLHRFLFVVTDAILPAGQVLHLVKDICSNTLVEVKWLKIYSDFICGMIIPQRTDHSHRRITVIFYYVLKRQSNFFFELSKKCSFKGFLVLDNAPGIHPYIWKYFKVFRALCYHQIFVPIHNIRTNRHPHWLPKLSVPLTFFLVYSVLSGLTGIRVFKGKLTVSSPAPIRSLFLQR